MPAGTRTAAETSPVAAVAVELALAHLDRPFDYLVDAAQDAAAVPGARVRVRFAGQRVSGWILARRADSEHEGRLAWLERVVSPEPVLAPEIAELARAVADRYAGTLADVLRLAVPPRHARVEAESFETRAGGVGPAGPAGPGRWAQYPGGEELLAELAAGGRPRVVWAALPGQGGPDESWVGDLAAAAVATLLGGRGVLIVVPDHRDALRVAAGLEAVLGTGAVTVLTADLGPAERYRRFLAVRRGRARAVVGTRAAVFAPVADLGLVAVWDDGDDSYSDPHAPYPHARDVAVLRAHQQGAALVLGGHAVSVEGAALATAGWARVVVAPRQLVRRWAPRVVATGSDAELARDPAARGARLPSLAWRTAREALASGPVLVQVPRSGYLPGLGCAACRAPARCVRCGGPLGQA
ncbi:MAG: primosomal protein N' family DNA-binding protein, partial [Mycobacteriales bacterium]